MKVTSTVSIAVYRKIGDPGVATTATGTDILKEDNEIWVNNILSNISEAPATSAST